MSNQPKNKLFDKQLNIYFLLFNTSLILIASIVCISLSIIYKNHSIIYGCIINIPFIYLSLLFGFITNKLILKNTNNKSIIVFSIFMYMSKYTILLLGMIIGFIVNSTTKSNVFNIYSLFTCVLIYPFSNIFSVIVYNKKKMWSIKTTSQNDILSATLEL